jgi:AbrB family looped-hinge helix DNA binding protein
MALVTVSSKGQITLPVALRRRIGLKPNDKVVIESAGDSIVIRRVRSFLELKGILGPAKSLDEEREGMIQAIIERNKPRR